MKSSNSNSNPNHALKKQNPDHNLKYFQDSLTPNPNYLYGVFWNLKFGNLDYLDRYISFGILYELALEGEISVSTSTLILFLQ